MGKNKLFIKYIIISHETFIVGYLKNPEIKLYNAELGGFVMLQTEDVPPKRKLTLLPNDLLAKLFLRSNILP